MPDGIFKNGDVVVHKTTDRFEMVVIGNCPFEKQTIRQLSNNVTDPQRYRCRYYNSDTKSWQEDCFYEWELESSSD